MGGGDRFPSSSSSSTRGRGRGGRGGRSRDHSHSHTHTHSGGRAAADPALDLPLVLYDRRPFRDEQDMACFARAALACSATLLNELLLQLGNDGPVTKKLRGLLQTRISVRARSFQNVALPLVTLFASRTLLESVHASAVKRVLRLLLAEPLFLRRVRSCIESETTLLESNGLLASSASALAGVLHGIVRKLPSAAIDDNELYGMIEGFAAWAKAYERTEMLTDAIATLDDAIEMCYELVPARRPSDNQGAVNDYLLYGVRSLRLTGRGRAEDAVVGDGFVQSPRHDNDAADFREVHVIPTDLEMRCLEPPYLPARPPVGAAMERHLDFHFRLLREDVLAQIRRGIQWALAPDTLARCLHTQQWTPPRENNIPLLNVALGARLEQLKGSIYKGVMFRISAEQPQLRGQSKKQLRAFWEREQRYKPGSLVCIASNVAPGPYVQFGSDEDIDQFPRYAALSDTQLVFATVGESNMEDLTADVNRFSVCLKQLETNKTADLVTTLTNPRQMNLLIEVRGLFFTAYEPILRTLQGHDDRSVAPELQQCLFGDAAQQQASWQRKPAYAQRLQQYNLQFLVKPDFGDRVDLSAVPVESYSQLLRHLRPYQRHDWLTLDVSQVKAFAAALTQQVCLIQGPPGTGKSYVGTKIVKGILDQTDAVIGPILCVCYTNHALDQFLEGLVDEGLPLEAIVRVGGRSKSEILESRSLNVLKHDASQSRQERYRFGQLKHECHAIEKSILDDFVESLTSSGSFFDWMRSHQPDAFAAIVGMEDDNGFQEQRQRKRDHKKRWHDWEQGKVRSHSDGGGAASMWTLPLAKREQLVDEWEAEWRESTRESIDRELEMYREHVVEAKQVNNGNLLRILRTSKVVGMTTTGCAIHQTLVRALAPEIVVCEEAGEVLEAHLLACLSSATQQVIQIGDHMQLRPILNEYTLSHECPGGRHRLDVSMFERLVRERTDAATGAAHVPGSLVTLDVQRRMRPEICDLIRRTLYPELQDGESVTRYEDTRGFTHNLWFFDHDQPEDAGALSHTNAFEAELLVELVAYAIKQGYGKDEITILTPYLGQLVQIRSRLAAKNFRFALEEKDEKAIRLAGMELSDDSEEDNEATAETRQLNALNRVDVKSMQECVRLSTVDNFQGNESQLVFISTVRCNNKGSTGFLKTFNRVNVMLSRAKSAMYLLGSASTVRRCPQAKMFNKVLDILEDTNAAGRTIGLRCQKHGTVTQVASAQEIRATTPDGGCLVKCDKRLRCGHSCPKLCHADDEQHVAGLCLEPCVKRVAACGHLCKARCHEMCRCREVIPTYALPCGHKLTNIACVETHGGPAAVHCPVSVEVALPFCQHRRTMPCAKATKLKRAIEASDWTEVWEENLNCGAVCGLMRVEACDHACQQACGKCLAASLGDPRGKAKSDMEFAGKRPDHFGRCTHRCERPLLCGHNCASFCHPAGQCPPCTAQCRNQCSHSRCARPCKETCASCAEPCTWSCPHGQGQCVLPCGSPCTRLPCDERCSKLLTCGHQCPGLCGEPCVSSAFCRACPPAVCRRANDVVDFLMLSKLVDHDPDESPLVRLGCGHCFTVETTDRLMEMTSYYEQNEHGQWVAPKPLTAPGDGATVKVCPSCRAPVVGVNRYGRVINFSLVHLSERKYLQFVMAEVSATKAVRRQTTFSSGELNRTIDKFRQLLAHETPTQAMLTTESSRLALLGMDGDLVNLNSFRSVMNSKAVLSLGLEILELLLAKLKLKTNSTGGAAHAFQEGTRVEQRMLRMSHESASHRSTLEIAELGLQLRLAFLARGGCDEAERARIVSDMEATSVALQRREPPAPRDTVERVKRLCEMVRRASQLSKAEKDAVFKVFATGNDAFAQGFGGHWYQCQNGHPYVITECGGAMEESTCPECGARIGGSSHRLNTSNTAATSFFE